MANEKQQPYGSVLLKADAILEFLSQQNQPKRLHEIATYTELTNPTALKILNTLLLIGYVQKDPDTKTFSLGPRLIKYANKSLHQISIKQIALPHLEALQEITEETVHLGIHELNHIKYISKIESKKPVSLYSEIGKTIPLYCSAMGKAVLAEFTDEEMRKYLASNHFFQFTENTIMDEKALYAEIDKVKELGYACDDGEHDFEVFCIACSITLNEKNYGAVSVSLPKYRLTDEVLSDLIKNTLICRDNILAELN
ncbi:IclR family transcriptional regulator [Amphibacillus sp. MSJ-3]|uniref:IclR family transcriptional regulator n=1 Tax=Amphibacillus sp. MSJ-3 TaxID=2841505 RepID=UPI001C0F23D1|nr:IclR family transcriptional regulator [Amphibacillus sp. MSJ-3]MBU5593794.1 IclR family transcriptional regulator [Amphibacillus sp. MSJ-3]